MGSESIAHEAEGRMGYWLRGHEGERNKIFIVLVKGGSTGYFGGFTPKFKH